MASRQRSAKTYPCEMLGAAEFIGFDQYLPPCANLRIEMMAQRRFAFFAQSASTRLDDLSPDLRHSRGGGAGPRREWKDVKMREPARVDEIERTREHILALGRESGDDIAAKHD